MHLRLCSVLLAFKNALKYNMFGEHSVSQRFAGDLQAFMANALFCQLNMTRPHLANGYGDGNGLHPESKRDRSDRRCLHKMQNASTSSASAEMRFESFEAELLPLRFCCCNEQHAMPTRCHRDALSLQQGLCLIASFAV